MKPDEMTMEQVDARLMELDAAVESMEDVSEVDAAIEEKRALLERKTELEEIQ